MENSIHMSNRPRRSESRIVCSKKHSMSYLVASATKGLSQKTSKCIGALKKGMSSNPIAGDIVVFLATTAALEIVRRLSNAKCPFVWRALQALQVLSYPPFKWLERWNPFKGIIKHTKKLSRPMLVLSIATVFSDQLDSPNEDSNDLNEIAESSGSGSDPNSRSHDEVSEASTSEEWLLNLHSELKRQGITVPERLNDDEFRQFYAVANGDFSKLLSSVKKTITWRQTYKLFSPEELVPWSHLVYWHGHDLMQRPCLIIRLGLACSNLRSDDKPLFLKAVVSQIEHGVVNLVNRDQPQIMVLMDCEGLSPLSIPIHTMKSCAILLQDHYPNRLSCMLIIRLPNFAKYIIQALCQVLRPATQRKLRIIGRDYQKVLSRYLQSTPLFLGGNCSCETCSILGQIQNPHAEITPTPTPMPTLDMDHSLPVNGIEGTAELSSKTAVVALLMIWLFVFLLMGMHREKISALYKQIYNLA